MADEPCPPSARRAKRLEAGTNCSSGMYELIASGQIEAIKIGRSTLIPYRCLKQLIVIDRHRRHRVAGETLMSCRPGAGRSIPWYQ